MKMTFKERLVRPSAAIQAMLDGLKEAPEHGVEIDMGVFHGEEEGRCFACAATVAALKATGGNWSGFKSAPLNECRYNFWAALAAAMGLDVSSHDLEQFEDAMDSFRRGYSSQLLRYFCCDEEADAAMSIQRGWDMRTNGWQDQIPAVEKYRDELIAKGL